MILNDAFEHAIRQTSIWRCGNSGIRHYHGKFGFAFSPEQKTILKNLIIWNQN